MNQATKNQIVTQMIADTYCSFCRTYILYVCLLYPMGQLQLTIYVFSITSIHNINWTILCLLNSNTIFTLRKLHMKLKAQK